MKKFIGIIIFLFLINLILVNGADAVEQTKKFKFQDKINEIKKDLKKKGISFKEQKNTETVQTTQTTNEDLIKKENMILNDEKTTTKENSIVKQNVSNLDKTLNISGYAQILHTVSDVPADSHSFNIQRSRFIFKRKLENNWSMFSQFNISGNNAESAQMTVTDLYAQYDIDAAQNVMIGQFLVPASFEHMIAPRDLYMINYSQLALNADHENRGNDLRDVGIRYNYRKKNENWGLSVAFVNGEGINTRNDSNDNKTIAARLDLEPTSKLKLGAYASSGKRYKAKATPAQAALYGALGGITEAGDFDRKRAGLDFRFKEKDFTLQGVYEALETGLAGRIKNLKGKGAFIQGGYFIKPKFELTFKYDIFKPNEDDSNSERKVIASGFNYFIQKSTKLQLVYQKHKEIPEIKNDRVDTQLTIEF